MNNVSSMDGETTLNYLIAGQTISFVRSGRKLDENWVRWIIFFLDFENFRGRKPPSIFLTNNDNEHRVITRATFSINNGIFQNEF